MKTFDANDQPNEYFKEMKDIEEKLLIFLDKQDELNENFHIFNEYLQDYKLYDNKYALKSFLYLIAAISNNYHRSQHFFTKIELILKNMQEKIQNYFHSFEIFQIFRRNKRLLLFLFKSGIITPNEEIYSIILGNKKYIDEKYLEYFFLEFEPFFENKMKIQDRIYELKDQNAIDEFNKKREKGENDNYLCNLIQNDLVVDFITYLEKMNISPSSTIQSSIFETNLFLMNKNPTLIEYSAFYGSIQIFKYLHLKNAPIATSIWPYAIHGRNAEIIHFLEDMMIETIQTSYQYLIFESIKCHHNEMIDYFRNNFCDNEKIDNDYLNRKSLKYYNFMYFTEESIQSLIESCKHNQESSVPYYLCKYDYFLIVEFLLQSEKISDLNYRYKIPIHKVQYDGLGFNDEYNDENNDQLITYYRETSTILNIATRKGNIDIIQLLLKTPKVNVNVQSTIEYNEPMGKGYLFYECYKTSEDKALLHEAVESGFSEVVQFILKNVTCDINNCKCSINRNYEDRFTTAHMHYDETYEKTSLHLAIERGYIEIVKLLLSNPNININLNSKSSIFESGGCVCYSMHSTTIKRSSLYFAIKNGRIKLIQILLAQPQIDIESGLTKYSSRGCSNKTEKSPLYLAVEKQNFEIVQFLSKQPKINIKFEIEALDLASKMQNNQIYQFLSNYIKL